MPYEKFTSAERRGLLLLTGLLAAAICAVAIARGCSGSDRQPLPNATTATPPAAAYNIVESTADGDSTATRQQRKKRSRKNNTRQTPEGRERSHRDESVLEHNTISADHNHDNGQ